MIGAIIGAGLSLLGMKKDRDAQNEANEANRPVNQVAEWEAAGINPAFGISQGQFIPHEAASIGDSFAQAGQLFADGVRRKEDLDLEDTAIRQENRELREELDDVARYRGPSYMEQYGGILPLPSQGGSSVSTSDQSLGDSNVLFDPTRTSYELAGTRVEPHMGWSDAEIIEQRYGDVMSWLYGVGTVAADGYQHVQGLASTALASGAEPHGFGPLELADGAIVHGERILEHRDDVRDRERDAVNQRVVTDRANSWGGTRHHGTQLSLYRTP